MKKLIILAILACAFTAQAAVITFAWDANTESDLAGYRIYKSTTSGQYTYGAANAVAAVGKVTTATATVTGAEGTKFYFVCTAYDTSGNESGPSNEVNYTIPDTTPPAAPKGFIARLLQALMDWLKNNGFRIS